MAWGVTAAVIGGASLVGSYMQSQASQNAAGQYSNAAQQGIQYKK